MQEKQNDRLLVCEKRHLSISDVRQAQTANIRMTVHKVLKNRGRGRGGGGGGGGGGGRMEGWGRDGGARGWGMGEGWGS